MKQQIIIKHPPSSRKSQSTWVHYCPRVSPGMRAAVGTSTSTFPGRRQSPSRTEVTSWRDSPNAVGPDQGAEESQGM